MTAQRSTVTLGSDAIIRMTVVGFVDETEAKRIIKHTSILMEELRSQGKRVSILVNHTQAGKDTPQARQCARDFIRSANYDRLAVFGANKEYSQALRLFMATFGGILRIRTFKAQAAALRWLQHLPVDPKRKAQRALGAACVMALLAITWFLLIGPYLQRLPDNFLYQAQIVSQDNFYDEKTAGFSGAVTSDTTFKLESTNATDGVLNIANLFDVRTTDGEKIFSVERQYGIDQLTKMHVPGHGDRDRIGYLFAPEHLAKQTFTYWHINYDVLAQMKFQSEEAILGLTTYRYAADFQADQTNELKHLPGVGITKGVGLDVNLQLWIEPQTGYLVKYEDRTTAYYYDLTTKQRLNPWNQFSNAYTFDAVASHVQTAEQLKQRQQLVESIIPTTLLLAAAALLLWAGWLIWQARRTRQAGLRSSTRPTAAAQSHAISRSLLLALLVLAGMVALTLLTWQQTQVGTVKQADIQFQGDTNDLHASIGDELLGYVKALQGAKGLFAASTEVSRNEWKAYVDGLRLVQSYPGMQGMGYVQLVPDNQKNSHIAEIRRQGLPSYTIHPDEPLDGNYGSVVYIEPADERNQRALGFNMLSDATRRAAMERARDTGEPAMSDQVTLIQETETDRQAGLLIFLPIYKSGQSISTVDERRKALAGYVYTPIRVTNFMRTTLGEQTHGLNVEIFDSPTPENLNAANRLFAADQDRGIDSSYDPSFVRTESLTVAGHTLMLRYSSLPSYVSAGLGLPLAVLIVGSLISLLLAALTFLLSSSRNRALSLASSMTLDLRTERNNALATQHKVEAILSSIGDGVFAIDKKGKIMLFNSAAELMSGSPADQAIGSDYKKVLHFYNASDNSPADAFIATALAGQATEMPKNTILRRKDGSTLPVADSAAPIVNDKNEVEGVVVVFRDVTREKQLEHMKDEFLSVASHELRTPMGAVRANISMILSGDYGQVNKQLVEPLTDMRQSTIRLVELVNDLLNVARIEAGRMRFNLAIVDTKTVLSHTISELSPLAKEKGLALTGKPEATIDVQADLDKVREVLTNLIGNSLKFTDKGGITVAATNQKDAVEITVADTGVGISTEDQHKLFGKFEQITSVQGGKPAGTGLGLYISREIIRKMGGELWIKESNPDSGSTFAFTLPHADSLLAKRIKQQIEREATLHPDQK